MNQKSQSDAVNQFMAREGLMLSSTLGLRISEDRQPFLEERIRAAFEAGFRAASAIGGVRQVNSTAPKEATV